MLQLWRTRPPRKRVSAAPSAQKVPFLSKCFPHGGHLSRQSTAAAAAFVPRLSGNLREERRRRDPGGTLWKLKENCEVFHRNAAYRQTYLKVLFIEWQKSPLGYWRDMSFRSVLTVSSTLLFFFLSVFHFILPWISVLALELSNQTL